MPYNIVLTRPAEEAVKYVEVSQGLYRDRQPTYLLTEEGASAPHSHFWITSAVKANLFTSAGKMILEI